MTDEDWRIAKVRMEGELIRMNDRLDVIDDRTKHMEANVSRLVWLVLTSLIGGLMAFIIGGGLAL